MPRALTVVLVLAAFALGSSGCASKTVTITNAKGEAVTRTVPDVHFAKAKFVLHMGLAFGAFHRYIYEPYRSGAFSSRSPGRLHTFVKAASAALFVVHELRTARGDALSSNSLRPLAERIEGLLGRLANLGSSFKHGSLNPGAIVAAAGAVSALGSASGGLGATVKEVAPVL